MIASPNYSQRSGRPVSLVVIHTAEGATTTGALGAFFARASVQASSHVGIDDTGIEQFVPYSMAAWTMLSANSIADQAELCGFAAWTRDQWIRLHPRMLELAAQWIRERCLARGIPIRKLTPAQVGAGEPGVCGHIDWTLGMHEGTHHDPGDGFPWDVVIQLAAGPPSPTPRVPAVQEDEPMIIPIQVGPDGVFRAIANCEAGASSSMYSDAWVVFLVGYGPQAGVAADIRIAFRDTAGRVMGEANDHVLNGMRNDSRVAFAAPDGCGSVTVEGRCYGGAIPSAERITKSMCWASTNGSGTTGPTATREKS